VRDVVETSARSHRGPDPLRVFVENWKRPRAEVSTLMTLLKRYLRLELSTLLKNNIASGVIGRSDELSPDVQVELEHGIPRRRATRACCFNIRSLWRPLRDRRRRAADAVEGVTETISTSVGSGEFLLHRRPGPTRISDPHEREMRVSNFLLWQIAYAESG